MTKKMKTTGNLIAYFILHNLNSVTFFFLLTVNLGLYSEQTILSIGFWELYIEVFSISIVSSILGRITAYFLISLYHKYITKRETMKWKQFNRGINKLGLRFLIASLISSLIYCLSITIIPISSIFDENTLITLILVYFGLKVFIYLGVRWMVGSKF